MHPNAFLRTFWRAEFRPQVFVAMAIGGKFDERFQSVIKPAVESLQYGGQAMMAHRVDLSKSGDSILTQIMGGVAHSALILADVSTIGRDPVTQKAYRNGNVMYEVGVALACRQPSEVLLVRDDSDQFLFDVSTVPHMHVDFADTDQATRTLSTEFQARLDEIDHVFDARLAIASATLTSDERTLLANAARFGIGEMFSTKQERRGVDVMRWATAGRVLPRLLDKQLLKTVAVRPDGGAWFELTPLGRALATSIERHVPTHRERASPAVETAEAMPRKLDK